MKVKFQIEVEKMKKTVLFLAVILALISFAFTSGCKQKEKKQITEIAKANGIPEWQQEWKEAVKKDGKCSGYDEDCHGPLVKTLDKILSKSRSFQDLEMILSLCEYCEYSDEATDRIHHEMIKVAKTSDELKTVYDNFDDEDEDFDPALKDKIAKKIIKTSRSNYDKLAVLCNSTFENDYSNKEFIVKILLEKVESLSQLGQAVACTDPGSEYREVVTKRMIKIAKPTFNDWLIVFSATNRDSSEEEIAFNKLVCLSKSFDEWFTFYISAKSEYQRQILLKKVIISAKVFEDWEKVFIILDDNDSETPFTSEENLAFSKMIETAKTQAHWKTIYDYAPKGGDAQKLAIKKGQELLDKAGCK